MQLYEKVRPRTWADVVGQDKAVAMLQRFEKRGFGGRAFWFAAPSGTGKNCLANIVAESVADSLNIRRYVGRELTVGIVQELMRETSYFGLGAKTGQVVVVDEAHGMAKPVIEYLLKHLEPLKSHCVWLFTTTRTGEGLLFEKQDDASAFASRCQQVPMTCQGLAKPFARRAREIAQAEGLDGKPETAYVRLLQKHRNNFRAALMEIEAGGLLD